MDLLARIKCAFTTKESAADYYKKLSKEELMQRRSSQFKIYLSTTLAWVAALVMTIIAGKMSTTLIILYTGVIIALLITTFVDYRKRIEMIDNILKSK